MPSSKSWALLGITFQSVTGVFLVLLHDGLGLNLGLHVLGGPDG